MMSDQQGQLTAVYFNTYLWNK